MEPMGDDSTRILVLNYNGEGLLAECLPSLAEAARRSPIPCGVTVIDNESTDGSLAYLAEHWPEVEVIREPNRGLASFNAVLARRSERILFLLNNDVKLEPDAIRPLLDALDADPDALFAAPQCWTFDGREYEGMRTRVRSRFGMVQGLSRVPDHLAHVEEPGLTASAGPILAVDRAKFLAIGGYDTLYFPGRIEDLDLGFRGWMAGWTGLYVPGSVAFHKGLGSFGPAFGASGCDRLAVRNTLLFAWKNLRGRLLFEHLAWLPARLLDALIRRRTDVLRAFREAWCLRNRALERRRTHKGLWRDWSKRQDAFFEQFAFESRP